MKYIWYSPQKSKYPLCISLLAKASPPSCLNACVSRNLQKHESTKSQIILKSVRETLLRFIGILCVLNRIASNEYTQYTISQYKKENHPKLSQICNYGICSKGPKNEFETAISVRAIEVLLYLRVTPMLKNQNHHCWIDDIMGDKLSTSSDFN